MVVRTKPFQYQDKRADILQVAQQFEPQPGRTAGQGHAQPRPSATRPGHPGDGNDINDSDCDLGTRHPIQSTDSDQQGRANQDGCARGHPGRAVEPILSRTVLLTCHYCLILSRNSTPGHDKVTRHLIQNGHEGGFPNAYSPCIALSDICEGFPHNTMRVRPSIRLPGNSDTILAFSEFVTGRRQAGERRGDVSPAGQREPTIWHTKFRGGSQGVPRG